ncbi:MAG: 4Fe-4S single cluster domain-containing protein [Clostridium sp.]
MDLRVYRILSSTKVEGPGTRFCIWVQGCPIRCSGCFAKDTWDFNGGKLYDVNELISMISDSKEIEGVTILGGEPFAQSEALYALGKKIKSIGLSIVCFTGYSYEYILNANSYKWNRLLSVIDLLIDGAYEEDNHDTSKPWIGSSNQNYRFLTSRYKYLESNIGSIKNKFEVRVSDNGSIVINGMGDIRKLHEKLNNIWSVKEYELYK